MQLGGVLSTSHVAKSFIGTGLLIPDDEDEKGAAGEAPTPGTPPAAPGAIAADVAAPAAAAGWGWWGIALAMTITVRSLGDVAVSLSMDREDREDREDGRGAAGGIDSHVGGTHSDT